MLSQPCTKYFAVLLILGVSLSLFAETDITSHLHAWLSQADVNWPSDWAHEYVQTIETSITQYSQNPDYKQHVESLYESLEVHRYLLNRHMSTKADHDFYKAEIRWFIEAFMSSPLSSQEDRNLLKTQFQKLYKYAAKSLKGQFPFLAEENIESCVTQKLVELESRIDNPLLPILLRPYTNEQMDQIRSNWSRLYRGRKTLWLRMRDHRLDLAFFDNPPKDCESLERQFIHRSLGDVFKASWLVIDPPPDYVGKAIMSLKERRQEAVPDRYVTASQKKRQGSGPPREAVSVEQWLFIFSALLETSCQGSES